MSLTTTTAPGPSLANCAAANAQRAATAAAATVARVTRALDILGADASPVDAAAGRLRVRYPDATLTELGALADPPSTKDAVAGRIRRLLWHADRVAHDRGVPDTTSCLVGGPA